MTLIAHFPFDGTVEDSIRGNVGSFPSFTNLTNGQMGGGVTLSADSSFPVQELRFEYSYAFWIKLNIGFTGSWRGFMVKNYRNPSFHFRPNDNKLNFSQADSSTSGYTDFTSNHELVIGEWTHVVFTCKPIDGGGYHRVIYINGEESNSSTISDQIESSGAEMATLNHWSSAYDIEEFRAYDHSLSPKEVKLLSRGLTLHYKFDQQEEPTDNLIATIGGTALYPNSWTNADVEVIVDNTCPIGDGNVAKMDAIENASFEDLGNITLIGSYIYVGAKYTMSWWSKGNFEISYKDRLYFEDGSYIHADKVWKSQPIINEYEWRYYEVEVEITDGGDGRVPSYWLAPRFFYPDHDSTSYCYLSPIQLEIKEHATPFVDGIRTGVVYDSSGRGNHAPMNFNTSPWWMKDSIMGKGSYRFEDSIFHSIVSSNTSISRLRQYSYSCWFNTTDPYGLLIMGIRQGNNTYQSLAIENGDLVLHKFGYNNNTDTQVVRSSPVIDGIWHHGVVTYDNGITNLYVDGTLVDSATHENSVLVNVEFQINYESNISNPSFTGRNYVGDIADVRVYATPIDADAVLELYQQKGSLDDTGNLHAYTVTDYVDDIDTGLVLEAKGSGFDDFDKSILSVGGVDHSRNQRGHNFVEVSPDGEVISTANIDSYSYDDYWINGVNTIETDEQVLISAIADYIDSINDGNWVLISTRDAANFTRPNFNAILDSLGFVNYVTPKHRYGWAGITQKGNPHVARENMIADSSGIYAAVTMRISEKFSVTQNSIAMAPSISEVGVSDGLVGWYPLQNDIKNYAGPTTESLETNVEPAPRGYRINGTGSQLRFGDHTIDKEAGSFCFWVNFDDAVSTNNAVFAYDDGATYNIMEFRRTYFDAESGVNCNRFTSPTFPTTVENNQWNHFCVTFGSSKAYWYMNGEFFGEASDYGDVECSGAVATQVEGSISIDRIAKSYYQDVMNGYVSDLRFYNRTLSDEDVEMIYKITDPTNQTGMSQTKDKLYIKNQFKEVSI